LKHSLACVGIVCFVALSPELARAQTAASGFAQAPLTQSLTGRAKEAFASAQLLYNNSDFAGAIIKYQQAYDLSKDPRLLFNMALCHRSLHAWARMGTLLRQYEREAAKAMSAGERADVDSALAAIQNLVGTVRLTVSQPGATVAVDGETLGETPLPDPMVLDLGKHSLTVSKPGFETFHQAVAIGGGGETNVSVALVAQGHRSRLVVAADEGATVTVDDRVGSQGRFDGKLEPGVHQVQVTEPGKMTYKVDVDLRDGETRTLQVTLESEKHGGSPWPWIIGGAVVAAGAAVAGYFLLQPSDTVVPVPTGKLGGVTFAAWRR